VRTFALRSTRAAGVEVVLTGRMVHAMWLRTGLE
jgi:hypothetical protein